MAEKRRARLRRQGWSALAHAHREALLDPLQGPPLIPSFSPELSVPDPSQFTPLSAHPLPPNPPANPSFAGVLKNHISSASIDDDCTDSFHEIDPSCLHTQTISRLHTRYPWADVALISDILQTLHSDEESTSAILASMSNDDIERVSAFSDAEHDSLPESEDGNNELRGRSWATEEPSLDPNAEPNQSAKGIGLFGCTNSGPMEPEWEVDDLYLSNRKDALKMSRASGKHARGAYKAFMNGDYDNASLLSKQAKKERIEAEKLHAEAAKQILEARNGEIPGDLWRLDLHGLHVNEAVAALQHRLQEIEIEMSNPRHVQDGPLAQRSTERLSFFQGSGLQGPLLNKELKVITGAGNHSRGGGSLPLAVQSFLIENRYKFEEWRPGVVAVHPKFIYQRK